MPGLSITPPPELDPADWAEEHLYIPVGNARPGKIRFTDMSYQRDMLNIVDKPHIRRVTLMQGAQTGKTTTTIGIVGYYTHHKPRSQICMQATQTDLDVWLETKFNPMMAANDEINACYAKPRSREGVNNRMMKSFHGGFLMFAWAGSPNTQRGRSAPIIICDEVDGYEYSVEGHPVELAWQRSATFGTQRLLIELSTPTLKGKSRIEDSFLEGDMRRFWVVCPSCGERQILQWTQQHVRWQKNQPETAHYHCDSCDRSFDDYERVALIRNAYRDGGGWEGQRDTRNHASFHLNSLYSPFRLLSDIVEEYESAVKHRSLQTFTNTILAQTWEEIGERSDAQSLYDRAENYECQVPDACRVLTVGLDVQKNRLEWEVVGWGRGEESWSIDYQVVMGDPTLHQTWQEAWLKLVQPYKRKDGKPMRVYAVGIDSGFMATKVYDAVKRSPRNLLVFALKGRGGFEVPEMRRTSTATVQRGRWIPDIWTVGVDVVKIMMLRRLNVIRPGPKYCHFPEGRDLEYYLQLTAEQLVTKVVSGFPKDQWEKIYENNEAWDCRVYAYAVLRGLAIDLFESDKMYGVGEQKRTRKPVQST